MKVNVFKLALVWLTFILLLQPCVPSAGAEVSLNTVKAVEAAFDPAILGTRAKNMKVLPAWTMRLCEGDEPLATYDLNGARGLKIADNACAIAQEKVTLLQSQVGAQLAAIEKLRALQELTTQLHEADRTHIANLLKQLNTEIAEKNKYKYKPSYTIWYVTAGAIVAAVGLAFGVGVWVAK